jgi:hypothetical protein
MKTSPKKGKENLVQVSAFVSAQQREDLHTWGDGNVSEGLRRAISTPHHAPSGAMWIECACQLPNPAKCRGPQVWATPDVLLVYGVGPTSIAIDCEDGTLAFVTPTGGGATTDFNLADLAQLAGRLPGAVIATCAPDHRRDDRGQNIGAVSVTALAHGLIELRPTGPSGSVDCAVALPLRQALQFVAEVAGLLARRVEAHQLAIAELNHSLAQV